MALFSKKTKQGIDPDPRFSLANERTFLAWVRTGIAALGLATALDLATNIFAGGTAQKLLVFGFTGMAVLIGLYAYPRWRSVEMALREERGLPQAALTPWLAAGLICFSLIFGATVKGWL